MGHGGTFGVDDALLRVQWEAGDAGRLHLVANLGRDVREAVTLPRGEPIFATHGVPASGATGRMPRYGVALIVERAVRHPS
jgi:hypothetical protein